MSTVPALDASRSSRRTGPTRCACSDRSESTGAYTDWSGATHVIRVGDASRRSSGCCRNALCTRGARSSVERNRHGLHVARAPVRDQCPRAVLVCGDVRVPLRQAPQGLRRHAQPARRRHRRRERLARGRHPQGRGQAVQPGGPGVEPHAVLELDGPRRRRRPDGAAGDAINEHFGSYDKFREEFKTAATGQFGRAGPGSPTTTASWPCRRPATPTFR